MTGVIVMVIIWFILFRDCWSHCVPWHWLTSSSASWREYQHPFSFANGRELAIWYLLYTIQPW